MGTLPPELVTSSIPLHAHREGTEASGSLIDLAISPGSSDDAGTGIVASQAAGTASELGFARSRTHSLLRYFSDTLGVALRKCMLVMPGDMLGFDLMPACSAIGIPGKNTPDAELELGHQVAALWCGAGVRISGRNSKEFEYGLRLSLALRWWQDSGEFRRVERMLKHFGDTRSTPSRSFISTSFSSTPFDSAKAAGFVIGLYDAIHTPVGLESLRAFVSANWGWTVPVDTAVRGLNVTP